MGMKIVKLSAVAVLATLAFSHSSMAREFADIYTDCGLGAMIAPRSDAVAAVTNVTWDLGTTAISSNISSPDTCKGGQAKTAAFIHDSYDSLANDLARGNGVYLDTLLAMSGCSAESQPELAAALRNDFAGVVGAPGYSQQSRFDQARGLYDLLYARVAGFEGECSNS